MEAEAMNVTINLIGETLTPGGNVLRSTNSICGNGVFIVLDPTPDFSFILPGFDADAVSSTRAMAAKLTELADEAERQMKARVAAVEAVQA
jgi:hypothetical protein